MNVIKIGTRGSRLALIQTNGIIEQIGAIYPECRFEIIEIKTSGDIDLSITSKTQDGGIKDMFTKEIDNRLINREIDIAVHSLKDVASHLHEEIGIAAVTKREDQRDVFISNKYCTIDELPANAIIGTSSIRRKLMLQRYRHDLEIVHLRGNIDTRLDKIDKGVIDGAILALSGIRRLSLEQRVKQVFDIDIMMPAISQGAIGVFYLKKNNLIAEMFGKINHPETMSQIKTERSFAVNMDAQCGTPIGIFTEMANNIITAKCCFIDEKTQKAYFAEGDGLIGFEEDVGLLLAKKIKDQLP